MLRAAGVEGVPTSTHSAAFNANEKYWWDTFTCSVDFCRQLKRQYAYALVTDGVSVGVRTCKPNSVTPPQPVTGKRKRAPKNNSSWVKGLPANTPITHQRIVGLDPGRNSLFTAVVHEQQATSSLQAAQLVKHKVLSWTRSRWQEESGIKHSKLKRELWLRDDPELHDNLLETPTAKVASSAAFGQHISHRLQHTAAAVAYYGARRYRQLRWGRYRKKQRAMAKMCNSIAGPRSNRRLKADTLVAYGDAKFACCGKGNEATPTSSLRRALGAVCHVCEVDEFRTSRNCCACHHEMIGMPLPSLGDTTKLAFHIHVVHDATCLHHMLALQHPGNQSFC